VTNFVELLLLALVEVEVDFFIVLVVVFADVDDDFFVVKKVEYISMDEVVVMDVTGSTYSSVKEVEKLYETEKL
jgi:hypothetical protein